jgi:hypothetical protein
MCRAGHSRGNTCRQGSYTMSLGVGCMRFIPSSQGGGREGSCNEASTRSTYGEVLDWR